MTAHNGMTNGNGTKKPLNIVIVGGSLGGLFAALALKTLNHTTTILERNPTPLLHNQGAGIVAGGDTLAYFKRYNRCNRPLAVKSYRRMYLNKDGEVVHKVAMEQNMTSWDLAYYLLRANYDGVGSEYCDVPDEVDGEGGGRARHEHGCTVTGLEEEGEGVRVYFKRRGEDGVEVEESIFADMVVAADGPSSAIRQMFHPEIERTYAGYCALRGTVPENEASEETKRAFSERFTFFHGPGRQILAYLIPGINGTTQPGSRLINFVYYTNFPVSSSSFQNLMTDTNGTRHRITMPPGKISPEVWEEQKQLAREHLPPQFAELVCKTKKPFCQAITDVRCEENEFLGGKVVLVGDALSGFRPHTVASTSQAAFDAMLLADMVEGKISRKEWKRGTMEFATVMQERGVRMGNRSQHQDLPLEEHISDRNAASLPRQQEIFKGWVGYE